MIKFLKKRRVLLIKNGIKKKVVLLSVSQNFGTYRINYEKVKVNLIPKNKSNVIFVQIQKQDLSIHSFIYTTRQPTTFEASKKGSIEGFDR
jgi:hypothetical protein